ncbi:hypothetical protein Xoosp13_222 [Xanthomonas phage Xoo-sp13]|nr:hypothetical protein Xoosp13_222 [Xanthomonas phage Xoo-sp13]
MTEYTVKYTDKNKAPIVVSETNVDNSSTDLSLFGRKRLEYGRDMNANFLHLLENFACKENPLLPGNPDLTSTSFIADTTKRLLTKPVQGQLWYNITQESLYAWTGSSWLALGMVGDIASNWGVIAHGSQLPKPQNQHGYVFDYDECAWIVTPFVMDTSFTYLQCVTDDQANVTMFYNPEGGTSAVFGCANYLIVGIKGNKNLGSQLPIPSATPAPSPTPTMTPTRTSTPVVSPTPSVTPTAGVSPTPTPTMTRTGTPAPSLTPSVTQLVYSTTITANPTGQVLPGAQICYTVSLNHPAPATGYSFTFTRSGDFSNVCASTANETAGPVLDTTQAFIPPNQSSLQICRPAPQPATPTPTPTAAPRYACRNMPGTPPLNGFNGGYCTGFVASSVPGGTFTTFTNSSGGNGDYNQCTSYCACNNATSFVSTQTIALNPVRGNVQYYNATPAIQLNLKVTLNGVGETPYNRQVYGTTAQTVTDTITVGSRTFTITINMTPVLVSSSGNNRTWQIASDYTIVDNETGQVLGTC